MTINLKQKQSEGLKCIELALDIAYISGSQSVMRGPQGICDQFPGDQWEHFCNGCIGVHFIF